MINELRVRKMKLSHVVTIASLCQGEVSDVCWRHPRPWGLSLPLFPLLHLPQEHKDPRGDDSPLSAALRWVYALGYWSQGTKESICLHQRLLLPSRNYGSGMAINWISRCVMFFSLFAQINDHAFVEKGTSISIMTQSQLWINICNRG